MQMKVYGEKHSKVVETLDVLALVNFLSGNYLDAEKFWLQATAIQETHRPSVSQAQAIAARAESLAMLYDNMGNSHKRLAYLQEAQAIREKVLGPHSAETLIGMTSLAANYLESGNQKEAAPLLLRIGEATDSILAKRPPPKPTVGIENTPDLTLEQKERHAKEAEATVTEIQLLIALGRFQVAMNNLASAETLLDRAEGACGFAPRHAAHLQECYQAQAVLCKRAGDDAKALNYLVRHQNSIVKALGQEHTANYPTLNELGLLCSRIGNQPKAIEHRQQAWQILERHRSQVYSVGTESEQAEVAVQLSEILNDNLAIAIERSPEDDRATHFAFEVVLSSKGAILDTLFQRQSSWLSSGDGELREIYNKWRAASIGWYRGQMEGSRSKNARAYARYLAELEKRKNDTEEELARASARFASQRAMARISLDDVIQSLPADSALINIAKYFVNIPRQLTVSERRRFVKRSGELLNLRLDNDTTSSDNAALEVIDDAKEPEPQWKYVAFVARRDKSGATPTTKLVPLGSAKAIEDATDAWRQAAGTTTDQGQPCDQAVIDAASQQIADLVWKPLSSTVKDTRNLYISPDGDLSFISFAALPGSEPGKFLVDDHDISYCASGRELVSSGARGVTTGPPVLVGAPSFGELGPTTSPPAAENRQDIFLGVVPPTRGISDLRALDELHFLPLPATGKEVELIADILRADGQMPILLKGSDATETAVTNIKRPSLLHLATHGFFLTDSGLTTQTASAGQRGVGGARPQSIGVGDKNTDFQLRLIRLKNPMHRSGVALSGANDTVFGRHPPGGDDGILTAEEVAGMELLGTKLVVISACESGLGEAQSGEGVFGLRRAFTVAGAQDLVLSLWPIADEPTMRLMESFYRELGKGKSARSALLAAQREWISDVRKSGQYPHPFYWAAFVESGLQAGLK
jgi:CHAT domain-containing protein